MTKLLDYIYKYLCGTKDEDESQNFFANFYTGKVSYLDAANLKKALEDDDEAEIARLREKFLASDKSNLVTLEQLLAHDK